MAKILAIETSTEVCSVALFNEDRVLASFTSQEPYSHAGQLTNYIDALLSEHDGGTLNAVSVSIGPGSFTGLRVGLSTAKGLCYALDIPLITIPSLEVLAYGAMEEQPGKPNVLMPMIDARRMEVYTCIYNRDLHLIKDVHALILNEEVLVSLLKEYQTIYAFGNGAGKIASFESNDGISFNNIHMHATFMRNPSLIKYNNQEFANIAYSRPFYLKPPNITTPKRTKL